MRLCWSESGAPHTEPPREEAGQPRVEPIPEDPIPAEPIPEDPIPEDPMEDQVSLSPELLLLLIEELYPPGAKMVTLVMISNINVLYCTVLYCMYRTVLYWY